MRAAHEEEKRRGAWVWRGEADETAPWGAGPERLGPRGAAASADGGQTLGGADADVRGVGSPVASVAESCAKLASLHFLRRKLDELEREVPARYAAMRASSGASDTPPDASTWLDGLLDGARQTTRSCAKKIANHLACKIVYWDLRGLFIDGLYRVGVRGGVRARAVVSRLEAALCEVADRLPGDAGVDARAEVASALLRAAAQGWTRVMLDGGPGRAFAETDHAALEEDLEEIRELFLAGGDGVPAPEVTAATRAAERLLVVMSLEFDVVRGRVRRGGGERRGGGGDGRREGRGGVPGRRRTRGRAGRERWVRRGDAASGHVPPRRQSRVEISQGEHAPPKGRRGNSHELRERQRRQVFRKGVSRARGAKNGGVRARCANRSRVVRIPPPSLSLYRRRRGGCRGHASNA